MTVKVQLGDIKATCNNTESGLFMVSLDDTIYYKIRAWIVRGGVEQPIIFQPPFPAFVSEYVIFEEGQPRALDPPEIDLGEFDLTPDPSGSGGRATEEGGATGESEAAVNYLRIRFELWEDDTEKYAEFRRWWRVNRLNKTLISITLGSALIASVVTVPMWIFRYVFINLMDFLDDDDDLGALDERIKLTENGIRGAPDRHFKATGHGADYDVFYELRFEQV